MAFDTFTVFCSRHHCLVPEHFYYPEWQPFITNREVTPYFPLLLSRSQPLICLLSLWIGLFWIFYINGMGACLCVCFNHHSMNVVYCSDGFSSAEPGNHSVIV